MENHGRFGNRNLKPGKDRAVTCSVTRLTPMKTLLFAFVTLAAGLGTARADYRDHSPAPVSRRVEHGAPTDRSPRYERPDFRHGYVEHRREVARPAPRSWFARCFGFW